MLYHAFAFGVIAIASQVQAIDNDHSSWGKSPITVKTHVNTDLGFGMVSSLIIGSEQAVLIDLPLVIPKALELADWVRNTTDKPLVAAFTTHAHADHYLSGAALLDQFPGIQYYANPLAAAVIKHDAPFESASSTKTHGVENVTQIVTIPEPYNFTFFTLKGDEEYPIHLMSPLSGDTVHETIFWIPSIKTLIAGDTMYNSDINAWCADQETLAMTVSWLETLDLVEALGATTIIPGHSTSTAPFTDARKILNFTRSYVEFFQSKVQPTANTAYTVQGLINLFNAAFPGLNNTVSNFLLEATAEEFGINGTGNVLYTPVTEFTNPTVLDGYNF